MKTIEQRQQLESFINNFYRTEFSVTSSRATGLLSVFLSKLKLKDDRNIVLVPSLTCTSIVHAVKAAGLTPFTIDSNLNDATLDINECQELIEFNHANVLALIVVHQYGNFVDTQKLYELCKSRRIVLIEDICQSMPFTYSLEYNDVILMSFGHSKQLACGSGGALAAKSEIVAKYDLESIRQEIPRSFPPESIQSSYRKEWYAFNSLTPQQRDLTYNETKFAEYKAYLLWGISDIKPNEILGKVRKIPRLLEIRKNNFSLLRSELENFEPINNFCLNEKSQPWRFNFLIKNADRDTVVNLLRGEITHVSKWYATLNLSMNIGGNYTKAKHISDNVINLWIDETVDENYIFNSISAVKRILSQC